MADDDDVVYIDVAPRVDERAAEDAGRKVRDKVKDGTKGLGKSIGDVLHSELGDTLNKAVGPTIHDWAADAGKGIGSTLGRAIGGDLGDSIGAALGSAAGRSGATGILDQIFGGDKTKDSIHSLLGELDQGKQKAQNFADAFKDFKDGDIGKGLGDFSKVLGTDLSSASEKAKDNLHGFSDELNGVNTSLGKFDAKAPGIEGAFGRIGGAIGKVVGPAAALVGLFEAIDHIDWDKLPGAGILQDLENAPGEAGSWLHDHFHLPSIPTDPRYTQGPHPREPGAPAPGPPGRPPDASRGGNFLPGGPGGAVPPGYKASPGSLDPFVSGMLPPGMAPPSGAVMPPSSLAPPDVGGRPPASTRSFTSGGGTGVRLVDTTSMMPSITSPEDLHTAGGNVRNLYAVAQGLEGTPYSQQLRNDCSGMVSQIASAALGLPAPSAGQRFSTVNEGQWLSSHGFQQGMGGPSDLSIGWYDHGGGNAGHTAATLPGGVNAESGGSHGNFMLGSGAAGASSSQFDHHMYLPMGAGGGGGRGGGGFRVAPAGYGSGAPGGGPGFGGSMGSPGGMPLSMGGAGGGGALPIPAAPTSPNFSEGNSYKPRQQQQMGSGQGFGLTGGGAIGMLESGLPAIGTALASGAGYDGSGAASGAAAALAQQLWANIGQPEVNLAITSAGKAAATAAMAPIETAWLGGGQMDAPEVGSPAQSGWTGKLLGSFMGSQFSGANIAGATQLPKQPSDDDSDNGENTDPGGGGKQQQGAKGAGGKGASGPPGTAEEPIHVNVKNQPPPAQGSATTASNAAAVQSAMPA